MWTIFKESEYSKIPKLNLGEEGFVYAFCFGEVIKIGSTRNPFSRLRTLKNSNKEKITTNNLIFLISKMHLNYKNNENQIHRILNKYRVYGEFFNITLDELMKQLNGFNFDNNNYCELQRTKIWKEHQIKGA